MVQSLVLFTSLVHTVPYPVWCDDLNLVLMFHRHIVLGLETIQSSHSYIT